MHMSYQQDKASTGRLKTNKDRNHIHETRKTFPLLNSSTYFCQSLNFKIAVIEFPVENYTQKQDIAA